KAPLPLVANLSGTRLYDDRCGWGRLWRWFYSLSAWLIGNSVHESRLKRAIGLTHQLYHTHLQQLEPELKKYRQYLVRMGNEIPLKEVDYALARRRITQWNEAVGPFLQRWRSSSALRAFFCLQTSSQQQFQDYYRIIQLEGFHGAPLPLLPFKK